MLIDFHTHVFPEKIAATTIAKLEKSSDTHAFTDGTVDGLVNEMRRGGADICVTLPVLTKPSQFDSVANFALSVNERFKYSEKRLISFGGIHPACDDIAGKMRFLKDNGIKGVKIHPDYQDTFIDDEGYYKILCAAKDNDMIVVTHAGVDDGYKGLPVKCPPTLVKKVMDRVPYGKFVLGHYGGHSQWEDVLDLLCGYDCYFDTAFTLHEIREELFKKILIKHGADKILFATDCPWRGIKEDYGILSSYGLDERTFNKITYENSLKLLGLEKKYAM